MRRKKYEINLFFFFGVYQSKSEEHFYYTHIWATTRCSVFERNTLQVNWNGKFFLPFGIHFLASCAFWSCRDFKSLSLFELCAVPPQCSQRLFFHFQIVCMLNEISNAFVELDHIFTCWHFDNVKSLFSSWNDFSFAFQINTHRFNAFRSPFFSCSFYFFFLSLLFLLAKIMFDLIRDYIYFLQYLCLCVSVFYIICSVAVDSTSHM